jgi:hypothetical protein
MTADDEGHAERPEHRYRAAVEIDSAAFLLSFVE